MVPTVSADGSSARTSPVLLNAAFPMVLARGTLTVVRASQPWNAPAPISTAEGMSTVVRSSQLLKAMAPTTETSLLTDAMGSP